ncbi:MAG TPA: ATP-binding protein [Longimicrobiales bacterium]
MSAKRLPPDALHRPVDVAALGFTTTAEIEPLDQIVGQDRPLEALAFGLDVDSAGFNIFVVGDEGTGRRAAALEAVRRHAAGRPVPDDLCYVNNFADPRRPRLLRMPPGTARRLADDMERLAAQLAAELPRVFGSDEYRAQRSAIVQQLEERRKELFARAEEAAERHDMAVVQTPQGIMLVPRRGGQLLTEQQLSALPAEQREEYESARREVETMFEEALPKLAEAMTAAQQAIRELNRRTAGSAAAHLFRLLRSRYTALPQVIAFLDSAESDLLELIGKLTIGAEAEPPALAEAMATEEFRRRYMVNVLVAHDAADGGAPVIVEPNPSFSRLNGRIEHRVVQGALVTDFLMIRAGALLAANGGYLIADALEVLRRPLAWDALKRALRQGEVRIEEPAAELGLVSTISLEPEPIPLDVKVVLIGPSILYALLSALDPDFDRIFKVKADFSPTLARTPEAERQYARFIAARCQAEGLPPFDAEAVAATIEYASRLAGDQTRLTAQLSVLADLVREAAFRAGANGAGGAPARARAAADGGAGADGGAEWAVPAAQPTPVTRAAVEAAIAARIRRVDRLEEELHRLIEAGTLLVSTRGEAVGQANGLSVIDVGGYSFARPVRVSASVSLGARGVVDIERESTLGGPIHSKAVLILSGYLNQRYGRERPLALTATLAFEQVYEAVEGDSASLAELMALLSAIAMLPLRQDLAITGSVDQLGNAQPVGGVLQKVEGFFNACRIQGFTGEQGVIVPARNARHLVLRSEVVEAVRRGEFHIHTVDHVDDALELLFRRPAAEVHEAVAARLEDFVQAWLRLRTEAGGGLAPLPPVDRRAA